MGIRQKVFCRRPPLMLPACGAARRWAGVWHNFIFRKVGAGKLIFCGLFKLMTLHRKMFAYEQRVASGEKYELQMEACNFYSR